MGGAIIVRAAALISAIFLTAQSCQTSGSKTGSSTAVKPGSTAAKPARSTPTGPRYGIVLMHGKRGTPGFLRGLASALQRAGFLVERPEMPWSRQRFLDRDVAGSMSEIASAVARLRTSGATRIILAGHSMGANAALAYAARVTTIDGLILMAPGHLVEGRRFQEAIGDSVRRANAMVQSGRGNRQGTFTDLNNSRVTEFTTSARIYAAWYDPAGSASMRRNAGRLLRGTPVLWVSGRRDPVARAAERLGIYSALSRRGRTRRVEVNANHRDTPAAARLQIVQWLKQRLQ